MPVRLSTRVTALALALAAAGPAAADPAAADPAPDDPAQDQPAQPQPAQPQPAQPQPAQATANALPPDAVPSVVLDEARKRFRTRNYTGAIPLLSSLLYPKPRLGRTDDLVETHVMLAVSQFELGNTEATTREFEQALFLNPELDLRNALEYSEPVVEFFEARKRVVEERNRRAAKMRREAEEQERLRKALENTIVLETKPYFINFVPFGAGQFQNGHHRKGILFFASEALLGGASLGLWGWQVGKYGFAGTVPREDAATVRRAQQVQIGTGAACLILMGLGIVDSLMHYQSTIRRPADESLLPDHLKPRRRTRPERKKSSLELVPTAAPRRAGVLVRWMF